MNRRHSSSLETLKGLLSLGLLVLAGCTNVAGDVARTITLPPLSSSGSNALFPVAWKFFVSAGYDCGADVNPDRFRCMKNLRDLYIHQTHAVVEIYPPDEGGASYTLVTNRWDEGLIPGELISGSFSNADVEVFCDFLMEEGIGTCHSEDGHAAVRLRFDKAGWGYTT